MAQYEQAPCHVVDARYLGDYKVWLEFNDGRKGVVDLADELYGEQFEELRDRERFAQFYLDYGLATIAWQGNIHHTKDRQRSIPLRQFAPLAEQAGVKELAFFHHDPMHSDTEVDALIEQALGNHRARGGADVSSFPAAEELELAL